MNWQLKDVRGILPSVAIRSLSYALLFGIYPSVGYSTSIGTCYFDLHASRQPVQKNLQMHEAFLDFQTCKSLIVPTCIKACRIYGKLVQQEYIGENVKALPTGVRCEGAGGEKHFSSLPNRKPFSKPLPDVFSPMFPAIPESTLLPPEAWPEGLSRESFQFIPENFNMRVEISREAIFLQRVMFGTAVVAVIWVPVLREFVVTSGSLGFLNVTTTEALAAGLAGVIYVETLGDDPPEIQDNIYDNFQDLQDALRCESLYNCKYRQ